MDDTIFALASARGKAGVAVVRVSGPRAFETAEALAGGVPPLRKAVLRDLSADGQVIDKALVIAFGDGASFTGERVVEYHVHGSTAVIKRLLGALQDCGCRPADAGEFTRRALDNGRLDLTQVEGMADLIDAETEAQRKQAFAVATGEAARMVEGWRSKLIRAAALIEATIDFADEDVPVDVWPDVTSLVEEVDKEICEQISGFRGAERIRDGFEVAIVGPPNVGKSTLLNRLAGREAAITSSVAGTTRDVIEVRMDLDGLPVTFLDTAGLREAADEIEAIGIERARQRAENADLRIWLTDGDRVADLLFKAGDLILPPKADLTGRADGISGSTGYGVSKMLSAVQDRLAGLAAGAGLMAHQRHFHALTEAHAALASVGRGTGEEAVELAAEQLRFATRALSSLVGLVDVEDLLDDIFASFCIGK